MGRGILRKLWNWNTVDACRTQVSKRTGIAVCVLPSGNDLRTASLGDDFTVLGRGQELDWFRNQMLMRYWLKFGGRLGARRDDDTPVRILNRIMHREKDAILY